MKKAILTIIVLLCLTLQASAQDPIRQVARRSVVEELTGTACGWCPRGWVGMNMLKEQFPDEFIGIALHNYNNTDPMYNGNYYKNSLLQGAPMAVINRENVQLDPYYGTGTNNKVPFGIKNVFEAANAESATVDVSLTAEWADEERSAVNCTATFEPLVDRQTLTLAFVLTADSLKGEGEAWGQDNYYAPTPSSALDDNLAPFGLGGEYGSSKCYPYFNDVMITSSYMGNINTARLPSGTTFNVGVPITFSFTLKMSNVNQAVLDVLDKNLVEAVVMVIDQNKKIANAAKAHIQGAASGISDATHNAPTPREVERFTLRGERTDSHHKGLQIVRYSDGSVRKYHVIH